MQKKMISLALASALMVPAAANAIDVIGKKLVIYGKVHISADSSDNDRAAPNDQSDFSLSSNSTRLGFKGAIPINASLTGLYKIEQEIKFDEASGTFATRNTYLGLKSSFGRVIFGHHDTPFKIVAGKWDMFGDTIGDRRSIMGAGATTGNKVNNRAKNMLMYSNKVGDLKFDIMYSPDGKDSASGAIDNNNLDMFSAGAYYKSGPLYVALGYVNWGDNSIGGATDVKGWRAAVKYKFGNIKLGFLYENIDTNTVGSSLNRSAWGLNGAVKIGGGKTVKVQYMKADDYDGTSSSGADVITLGLFGKLNKKTTWYAAYTRTDNDSNAKYQGVDGGHGDEVKTDLGGSPSSFSLGIVFKF